jgi:hypothetical protein
VDCFFWQENHSATSRKSRKTENKNRTVLSFTPYVTDRTIIDRSHFVYIKRLSIFLSLRILNLFTSHSMVFQLFYRIILPTESKAKQSEDTKKHLRFFLLSPYVTLQLSFLLFD